MNRYASNISCFVEANAILDSNPILNIGAFIAVEDIMRGLPKGNIDHNGIIFFYIFFKGKKCISKTEFQNGLMIEGILIWAKIPPNQLEKFVSSYNLNAPGVLTKKQKEPIADKVDELLRNQQYKLAADYIINFDLIEEFDISSLCQTLIKRDLAHVALNLAEKGGDLELIKETIQKLNYHKDSKIATNAIKKHKFDPKDFKRLLDHQVFGMIRSFVKRHGWMKAEEIALQNGRSAVNTLVKVLTKNKQYPEAYSVVQRHSELIDNHILGLLKGKCKNPGEAVENKLTKDNYFGPTEVFMNGEKEEDYLLMKDFGFNEEDLYFVHKNGKDLDFTIDHFLKAKRVLIIY